MTDEVTVDQQELALQTAGDQLRQAREKQRMTLANVAGETRIPIRHLEAIENGDFAALPARTYAIGFSRTYARLVGLEEEEIIALVRDELGEGGHNHTVMSGAMEPGDPAKLPSSGLAWFGAIGALLLVAGLMAFYATYYSAGTGPASLLEGLEQAEAEPELEQATAQAESTGQQIDPTGAVVFTALEDGVWVRFYDVGGERLFEKQMVRGEQFQIPGDAEEPRINTGRPDAFEITIGGRNVPKLAEEPITLGDAVVSAEALLARALDPTEPSGT